MQSSSSFHSASLTRALLLGTSLMLCGAPAPARSASASALSMAQDWNSKASQPNGMYGSNGSVQNILQAWGVSNNAVSNYLSWNGVLADVNANRPFVIRFDWTNGGGHIMVGRAYDSSNGVNYHYIMNPWPGEGQA